MRTLFTLVFAMNLLFCAAQQYQVSYTGQSEFSVDDPKIKIADGYLQYEKTDNKMQLAYTAKLYKVRFGIKLTKYDEDMHSVKELALENGERAFGPFDFVVKYISNKLYLFYFTMAGENEDGDISIFAAEINTADLTLGTPVKLMAIDQSNGGVFKAMKVMSDNDFEIKTSPDKSKILVFWTANGPDGSYNFKVFNPDFTVVAEKKAAITALGDPMVKSVCVDNPGDVFIGYKGDVDKNMMETHIIVCAVKKKEKDVALHVADYLLPTMCLYPAKKDNLIHVAGLYGGEDLTITGTYHATINATLPKITKPEVFPFPDTLMKQFIDEGWGVDKKKAHGLKRLINPVPYELEDGSFGMANEFRDLIMDNSINSQGQVNGVHSHILSGSILNIRFSGGKCIASRIPKHRNSAGRTTGDSYTAALFHNTVVFFYPDNEKNLSKPLAEVPYPSDVYTNSVLVAASVDTAGNVKREKLIDKKEDDFLPVADQATSLPDTNNIYMPVQKIRKLGGLGKEAMWAKIEIN